MSEFQIPRSLHDLLNESYSDLVEVLKNPRYRADFGYWHEKSDGSNPNTVKGLIYIDLAGAMMVRRLHICEDRSPVPEEFPRDQAKTWMAIDALIHGFAGRAAFFLRDALKAQGVKYDATPAQNVRIPVLHCQRDGTLSNAGIESAIGILREAGV